MPAKEYARWQVMKARYIGRDGGIERWRPMFAALKLYKEAVEDIGLESEPGISDRIERLAESRQVMLSKPGVQVVIEDPKQALAEFKEGDIDDLDCFSRTLDRLDTDLSMMRERANAWAVGDIESLRLLPFTDQYEACRDAARSIAALTRRAGDLAAQVRSEWIGEAERALGTNDVTLAILPMRELLSGDGMLAELASRGYTVQAPGEYAGLPGDQAGAVPVDAAAGD